MIFLEIGLVDEHPEWQFVLAAYHVQELAFAEQRAEERKQATAAANQQMPDDEKLAEDVPTNDHPGRVSEDRWIPRLMSIEGVSDEELSGIHGKLIAFGFLKFQLQGREGLSYQLTQLGRLGALPPKEREAEDDEEQRDGMSDAAA